MAGLIGLVFFAYLSSETESRSINRQKENKANISSYLDLTNLVYKGFIIWKKEHYFCGIPSEQDSMIIPTQVAKK